jgi:hypothetical protein
MRTQLKVHQVSPASSLLSTEQALQLKTIGFCMIPTRYKQQLPNRKGFWNDTRYLELQAFYQLHGHGRVPVGKPKTSLRYWLDKMQTAYQELQQGRPTSLTPQDITKLNSCGFELAKNKSYSFDERSTQWLAFKAKHDDGEDPLANSGLGRWIQHTRKKHVDFLEGNKTTLTRKQVDRLTEWGFQWKSNFPTPKFTPRKTFEERLVELAAYKIEYGDTLVPQIFPGLGIWVASMRKDYAKLQRGEKSFMTAERIATLRDAGFVFERQAGGPRFPRQRVGEKGHPLQTQTLRMDEDKGGTLSSCCDDETSGAAAAADTSTDCGENDTDSP